MEELNPTPNANQPQVDSAHTEKEQAPQEVAREVVTPEAESTPEASVETKEVLEEPAVPAAEAAPAAEANEPSAPEEKVVAPEETEAAAPEEKATEAPEPESVRYSEQELEAMTLTELVDALATLLEQPTLPSKRSVDNLRRIFSNKKRRAGSAEADEAENAAQNEAMQIQESRLNDLYHTFVERFREQMAKQHEEALANLEVKKGLAARLKSLIESNDDFGVITKNFREIQQEWRNTGKVPESDYNELQREWSQLVEQFYDLRQLNDEFRAYDFKKNLASKQELIERAKALTESNDPPAALREINDLHLRWKEIGPVEKDLRDEIWKQFSEFSKVVRQRADDVFLMRKAEQEKNMEEKRKICEAIEEVPYADIQTYSEWRTYSDKVIELQRKWKEIGPVPQSESKPLYSRMRAASDLFFSKRTIFYKEMHEQQDEIYNQKLALVEEAEALSTSTDWGTTAERLKALQQEWKEGGHLTNGRRSRELWERLRTACDTFFNARNEQRKQRRRTHREQMDNMKRKQELTEEVNRLLANEEQLEHNDIEARLGKLVEDFRAVGFVPSREKDAVHKAFYDKVNDVLRKHNVVLRTNRGGDDNRASGSNNTRTAEILRVPIAELNSAKDVKQRMEALIRDRDRFRAQILTASGNADLITSSSKWGNEMMQGVEKNIDSLKRKLDEVMNAMTECRAKLKELREAKDSDTDSEQSAPAAEQNEPTNETDK